ncbi:MAG: hypothetical protein Q9163_003403 [Psora crenata]
MPAYPLAGLTADLDRIAPRIDIQADQIHIIDGPTEFYDILMSKIRGARRRIYLSTLYIGKSEHELIATIRDALTSNATLHVSILTDALRGTREAPRPSCASLLAPLVRDYPERVEVRMYHTPNLTGFRKVFIPKRINEGWGLQHIKLYGIDDEVILSGANLSHDYFSNRQDRYHVFSSKRVADYFARIHDAVCSVSCLLQYSSQQSGHKLTWPVSNNAPDPLMAPEHYMAAATSVLTPLVSPPTTLPSPATTSTSVYPLLCHPPTLNTELPILSCLLSASRPIRSYTFTAGYFNPHPLVTSRLLALSSPPLSASGTILTASPYANGFFGSKGISGMLPAAYTRLSTLFLQAAREKSIQLREWQRGIVGRPGGWTYHAKGLWIAFHSQTQNKEAESTGPSVTLIGSSNYTTRSYGLDLEVGALVVTSDAGLQEKWKQEEEALRKYTKVVTEQELGAKDRRASWRVRLAMWIVNKAGGAL